MSVPIASHILRLGKGGRMRRVVAAVVVSGVFALLAAGPGEARSAKDESRESRS